MKTTIILIFYFFSSFIGYAQSYDSIALVLKDKVENSATDSIKIAAKIELIKKIQKFDLDTCRIVINEVLTTLKKKQKSNRDTYYKKKEAEALNYLGIIENKQGNPEKALSYYLKALDISKKNKDSTIIGLGLHNLGMFYRRQKNYEKSIAYLKKALVVKKGKVDVESYAMTYHMLAVTYYKNNQKDSARYYISKIKKIPCSSVRKSKVNGTLAAIYYSEKNYKKSIEIYKENIVLSKSIKDQSELSISYLNVAVLYNALKKYDNAIPYLDSAIVVAKKIKDKRLLRTQYFSKSNLNETRKDFKQALKDYKVFKKLNDSINNIEKVKRITELELNYKFKKQQQEDELRLENETTKKRLYLLLFMLALVLGGIILWLVQKNNKQQLALYNNKLNKEQLDKVRAELALVTKEKELKKAVVESSLRQEVLSKTLGEIKEIIKLDNEKERNQALHSIFASLLSEEVKSTINLNSYLERVSTDFKVVLDTKFSQLNEREKELLCLMTLDLNATEISKLQNSTISAIKSSRSRIRKKLGVDSKEDIISFINNSSK
ncbi:Tetratricopeptide repeat protein [Tenacibaculum sp. 190524A02b]|uniref:Tetratricopeptide repeat protein n=1 Tax=Tenacibaculum vairaonense TaxID=3137860 RepID=A0ABM9PH19_9FLAO